jgi:hypothetical protein
MTFEIEQSEFEGCEQPAGARADHNDIGGDFSGHFKLFSGQHGHTLLGLIPAQAEITP